MIIQRELKGAGAYVVDTRSICNSTQFVLTEAAHPRIVLKHGGQFVVFDETASIPAFNTLGYGYYRNDTRHLSQWELSLNGEPLSLLSSDLQRGYSGRFIYTNPQVGDLPQQTITVERQIVLDSLLWERLSLENYGKQGRDVEFKIKMRSDFADMFEVRGLNRSKRGELMVPSADSDGSAIFLAYRGLDGLLLETLVQFVGVKPDTVVDGTAVFRLHLPVRQPLLLELCLFCRSGDQRFESIAAEVDSTSSKQAADEQFRRWRHDGVLLRGDQEVFNIALERSFNDLYILRQPTPKGYGLAAGIPWYASVFGRDSAITGMQVVPFLPALSRECVEVLSAFQGQRSNVYREEKPGRIMHELRLGELARSRQIPHSPYFGTVDATPLWLRLFCEYFRWSGDIEFAESHWLKICQSIAYLERSLEEGNGYLRYKGSPHGLANQGWKDSSDSMMHRDGLLAQAPIAVCEAQAYYYAALLDLVPVAEALGHRRLARKLSLDAGSLKERFQKDFWMESEGFICLALDKFDRQLAVISSNAGHCLWSGILDREKANLVADRLMAEDMHSGWGIRTLSMDSVAFNPVSYHNGSVWPHDNAIIGEGMRKIGRVGDMLKIMNGIVDVAMNDPEHRLPELFCGFDRVGNQRPVDYPVSCRPQAWAAGSLLQMVKACLNFQPDAVNRTLKIVDPVLPDWLKCLTIRRLQVGGAVLDLAVETQEGATYARILRKSGTLKVIVEN
ncbi:MAG: amylo-alpha-1,6-glucosidase [Candidatus Melainabacteria bacterium]|nr:amylo-alpha-1,6-glucosidase [Candidatus Melainabacteria bacterium]